MAMARVWTTMPCEASRSLRALRIVPFCWSVMLRQSASESGWVSHAGTFVETVVVFVSARLGWTKAARSVMAASKFRVTRNVLRGEFRFCLFIDVAALLHVT